MLISTTKFMALVIIIQLRKLVTFKTCRTSVYLTITLCCSQCSALLYSSCCLLLLWG